MTILIKGAGDLASGVAHRLHRCGFDIVMTETAQPTTVRCSVAFSRAAYDGAATVEGVTARLAADVSDARRLMGEGFVALLVDPGADCRAALRPDALIDAVIAKQNLGTSLSDAPIVVALGPGFTAGVDCHAVVETKRGHDLGRVFFAGCAAENTGIPGEVGGYTTERIIRACRGGLFVPITAIGMTVRAGDPVASVAGEVILANIGGVVRGLLPHGTPVHRGMKSGDIDPRGIAAYCETISDKARAIAGGTLEAVLALRKGATR